MRYDRIVKEGESLKQALNRLKRARATALSAQQSVEKLDKKIAFLESYSAVTLPKPHREESRYTEYKGMNKRPMQGGKMTPK